MLRKFGNSFFRIQHAQIRLTDISEHFYQKMHSHVAFCVIYTRLYRHEGFSEGVTNLLISSWTSGTGKQYDSVIDKWHAFCRGGKVDPHETSIPVVLDFLYEQFNRGLSASAIGTYRSALSAYLPKVEGRPVGELAIVSKLVKGIKNARPSLPRYATTWDTDIVINYLKSCEITSLKRLTLKLTMLLALVTAQRAQTLNKLNLKEMEEKEEKLTFRITESLKTRGPGCLIELKRFPDEDLCVVHCLQLYIEMTKCLRETDYLLVSWNKPHKQVHVDTIRQWLIEIMTLAGIDTKTYKAHSTRAAATSKAKAKNVPIKEIMEAAMWNSASTFARFYDKRIEERSEGTFQRAILESAKLQE